MELTGEMFLATILGLAGVAATIGVPIVLLMLRSLNKIEKSVKPIEEANSWLRQQGIEAVLRRIAEPAAQHNPKSESNPFTPEEELRRQELLDEAERFGLYDSEIEELQGLLRKKAQDDFAKGLIGILALVGLGAIIAAIADSLKKKENE